MGAGGADAVAAHALPPAARPAGRAAGIYRLSPCELASELAYTFTGTGPSEELLAKAERGALASPEALVAEARALLRQPGRAPDAWTTISACGWATTW